MAGCIWLATGISASAFDRIDEFAKAKPALQQQLRSKQPAMRIEAVRHWKAFRSPTRCGCCTTICRTRTTTSRAAAFGTLLKMSGNHEVCETLLSLEKKAIGRKNNAQEAAVLLALLLSSNLPSVKRDTDDFLDKIATSHGGLEVVETMADEMGARHDEAGIPALLRLSKTKVFAHQFGLRRAVVQALTQIPKREAMAALIELLQTVHGEAQADIAEYLTQVTGQIFGLESAAWQRWWEDVKDTYEVPRRSVQAPYRSALTSASGYYYGLPLFAERLVFVLDTSGSMSGARIQAAKRELVRAITNLPGNAHFGVVVFNSSVNVWQKKLVEATPQAKNAAIHYVNNQDVGANTASYNALEAAFGYDTEAIYFLSDSAPHGGKIPAPVNIVTTITAMNKTRRVSLYTIGIGAGLPGGPLDVFLRTLAEENLGLYRRVDG